MSCNPCECVTVSGYSYLVNEIKNDISSMKSEIAGLTIDDTNRATLNENTETIETGIPHVEGDGCKNAGNVESLVNQLSEIYKNVKIQILQAKSYSNPIFSGGCSIKCPNERYVKNRDTCKCICEKFTCDPSTEMVDLYGCKCNPK
jgi:hypothetical protein